MDVHLYVYDLSKTCRAGATHHGQPMEIIKLGQTSLPMEVILEYLESLKTIYTPESYDLFMHNCNNFSNDFAMFLVGKDIPDHITSLPQTVLNTPFGQMLRPQIDAAMRPITQAPTPQPAHPIRPQPSSANGTTSGLPSNGMGSELERSAGMVNNITSLKDVDRLLDLAKDRCAIIFFTSSTCAPCKLVYQPYDNLAAEAGTKCVFIKIDFSHAERSISARYPHVRATPTFITYLKGEKQDEWSGADPRLLRSNVEMLVNAAFPPHPHLNKSTPTLLRQSQRPVKFTKVPPLEKLVAKMGDLGSDPAVSSIVSFIQAREQSGAIEAPLTKLPQFAAFLRRSTSVMPPETLFTVLDLLRIALTDIRVAGFFAEEHKGATGTPATVHYLLDHVDKLGESAPYPLRLTTLHLACNLFTSPLFIPHVLSPPLSSTLVSILTTALLDEKHAALKASALTLALNISSSNHQIRMKKYSANPSSSLSSGHELPESEQVELLASLLENISTGEQWSDNMKMSVICVGWLVYAADMNGELSDLWKVMDAAGTVGKAEAKVAEDRLLVKEVKSLLEV
ncbi:Desumoylating isopeptidase 1 [Pyrenophora seminiperda CCB06]|uniref:Desumoylating isopeptidase 1 n=1 Tax=Pyrenophora seminiperda CCB06 TaxID=1302712 RepID=A0A3M7M982_9PLEO|nr:Desumoylating isopeptidase 1 [Pyrenophora seminiperda CCB06]